MKAIDALSVNSIRVLAADAIQKANSGHPGLPLGSAPMAYELWANHMNHNPANPKWENRDRFILSGGHGSMLLYSLLHLFGYGLTKEDIMNFRQLGSLTPGHPEYGHTVGVEATTGPLGAGMGMAVGMALAEKHLAAVFNKENYPVVDHYTYVLGGDGCMMEGISSEAFSLAGTMGLSKLIVLYDSNRISIEGSTDLAFRENVEERMKAFGFQTITVEDGTNLDAIGLAIEAAKADTERPSFITIKTEIGYGCPAKQGKASAHGEPLGVDNVKAMRETLGWPYEEPFFVPDEVYAHFAKLAEEKAETEAAWNVMFAAYCQEYPEMEALWEKYHSGVDADSLMNNEKLWLEQEKPEATRSLSGKMINLLKDEIPGMIGGSADLGPSNKTEMKGEGDFSAENPAGRNIHFGVRELAMAAIGNALSSYTAQNIGAEKHERISLGYRTANIMVAITAVILCLFLELLHRPLIALFLDGAPSAQTVATGEGYLRFIGFFFCMIGFKMAVDGILRGAGAVKVFTIANLVNLGLRVLIAKLGAPVYGIAMIWYAVPLGWLANFLISYGYYRTGKWKQIS